MSVTVHAGLPSENLETVFCQDKLPFHVVSRTELVEASGFRL